MKIYNTDNNTCPTTNTVISTGTSIPTLTNVAIIPDNTQTCNVACTERCQNLGRFRTLGVANIDPKQSYVCGSTTLKVCGNLEVCDDLTVNGNLTVVGNTTINNLTVVDLTVTGNLVACDISACNIDISQNLTVAGNTTLVDVSATNIDISQDLTVGGDTTLVDVSANIIQYLNNSQFFNWGVHIIPINGIPFTLTLLRNVSVLGIQTVETPITWGIDEGGWIYPGYGGYGTKIDHGFPSANTTWSDRSSYPTDGLRNPAGGWSFAIGLTIPFDGHIIAALSRLSWTLGRYDFPPGLGFTLTIEIYVIRCRDNGPQAPLSLATCRITRRCGHTTWNTNSAGIVWTIPAATTVISAGDAIGIYINRNIGETHSPATFTLEVQRDI